MNANVPLSGPVIDLDARELRSGGLRWMNRAVDALAREHSPLLKEVSRETVSELPQHESFRTPPARGESQAGQEELGKEAELSDVRPILIQHRWCADIDTAVNFDVGAFLTEIDSLAQSFGSQIVAGMLVHLSDVTEAAGQTIEVKDGNFWEAMIEALETMEVPFDDDGNHHGSIVMHPDTARKLENNPPTPEQQARASEILNRKREAWFAARRLEELP